uniref:UBA domain-containing protein n=1 Tax=Astatotilapia calliptera TaxID=8154 RepID=A0AAX7UH13_ASTCA
MAEQNLEAKLKNLLKQEKIQLWNPPYTEQGQQPGRQHMQELAERYAHLLRLPVSEVGGALESIRAQAVKRGRGNQTFRETSVATLELLLPRDAKKDPKVRTYLETRLDVSAQQVVDRVAEEHGLRSIKLILSGRTLSAERRLDEQGVKNHSKVMVLRVSDGELKQQLTEEEEERRSQEESVQRTQKGFQILSERDGSEDPHTTPFLEIADQKGNPLKIPPTEKKVEFETGRSAEVSHQGALLCNLCVCVCVCVCVQALILAMGFHEKGRALMKRKQHDNALCHLLQADQQFRKCGSALLSSVDNYAVLQLDIVWCYRALEALSCLEDGRSRLQRAEDCFLRCYGEQQERLLMIKGNTGREEVLFLRLYLLQSLLSYIEGSDSEARLQLSRVESLYARLRPDSEKMAQLMALGFSEREARLGLRASRGDLQEAAIHISTRRQEREELKQRERQKRRTRMEAISALMELGFSQRDAARALHHADGNVDRAYAILLDSSQDAQATNNNTEGGASPEMVEQLLYLGFERDSAEAALRLTGGDVQSATQLLLDNQGVLSPELLTPPSTSSSSSTPSSEEPSSASSSPEDSELVSEVLEDIAPHEEDYLDLTLEEESELISAMKAYLHREPAHT